MVTSRVTSCRVRLALLLVVVWTCRPASAQNATGRIIGVISDQTGAVVPGVTLTLTNVDTGITNQTVSVEDGSYQFLLIPIGNYRVAAELPGFRSVTTTAQRLEINQSLKVDVRLEVGAAGDAIEVAAQAGGVETVTATLGSAVTVNQIRSLPLNGRNIMDLAPLQPGVIPAPNGTTRGGSQTFSIAGARSNAITFLIDGAVNSDLMFNGLVINPNPDATEEFRVIKSNYSAEYGRNAGGVVSVVTRSGTNEFHGAVYDYVRNAALNANSFFNNQQGLPKSNLKRNQFGGTLSGPIIRNKLFFMGSYQGQRLSQRLTANKVLVPTPAELAGDFSRSVNGGPDPAVVSWLGRFPQYQPDASLASQAIISPNAISPVAKAYIKNNLIPNSSLGYVFPTGLNTNDVNELTGKIDYALSSADHFSATLGGSHTDIQNPFANASFTGANVEGYPNTDLAKRFLINVTYVRTFSPTLINEVRFAAQRNKLYTYGLGASLPAPNELGVNIHSDDPNGPPRLSISSLGLNTGFSQQGPANYFGSTYTVSDALTWVKGRHSLKFGLTFIPYVQNIVYDYYVNGQFDFFSTGGGTSFSGNGFANFLMGLPDRYRQYNRDPENFHTHNLSPYFQDEWKVTKNLTLNLGFRYEYNAPRYNTFLHTYAQTWGQQSTLFPNAPIGLLFPGDPGAPRGSNFADRNDWAPRFGFAFDPRNNGRTSIRGGIGLFYDIPTGYVGNINVLNSPPFVAGADLSYSIAQAGTDVLANPYSVIGRPDPFPSRPFTKDLDFARFGYLPFGGTVGFFDPHLRTPYVYQYNLSVQREIMRDTTLEVAYIGSSSHKLTGGIDRNPFVKGANPPVRLFNTQPGINGAYIFREFPTDSNVGQAHYNSMALGLTKRFSDTKAGPLSYQLSYTWGKSIDNQTDRTSVPFYNWFQFKGPSDFDINHYLAINGTWQLPFDRMWAGGPKVLTRGWTIYPIVTRRSGLPLNVKAGLSTSGTNPGPSGAGDASLVQANLVGPITLYEPANATKSSNGRIGNYWFDPAAFSNAGLAAINGALNPSLATYGTLGRNSFRGPSITNVNVTVGKSIDLHSERKKAELRADFFNALNTPQWQNPNTSISSGTFGQITGTGTTTDPAARVIQLSLRLTF
jgi:outer membrane receptor protein involved in Fe transport